MMHANDLDAILTGDPIAAMEAAKRLVQQHNLTHNPMLTTIAGSKAFHLWSRIAAIWTLGFNDDDAISVSTLERISQDDSEAAKIKEHALEALDHLG